MNASDRVYMELRRRLMTGHYQPGLQLKEQDLAAEFNLSRTPIRNALIQLTEESLLVSSPNRGVFVAEWTVQDIDEVFQLRRLLEAHGAGLAALRRSPQQLEELKTICAQMQRDVAETELNDNVVSRLQSENSKLHHAILLASKSPRLIAMCDALTDMPIVIKAFFLYDRDQIQQSIIQHEQIIRAITTQSYDSAVEAMSIHLRSAYQIYRSKHSLNTAAP